MKQELEWRKSSYSGQTGGDCVEVAQVSAAVLRVRDSKAGPTGPQLTFPAAAWQSFAADIRSGNLAPQEI